MPIFTLLEIKFIYACFPQEYRRMMGPHNSQQTVCALVEMLRAGKRLPSPPNCPAQVSLYNVMQEALCSPIYSLFYFSILNQ